MAARRRKQKPQSFTDAARAQTDRLIDDLLGRAEGEPGVAAALRHTYDEEKKDGRTGEVYSQWRRLRLTQVAAAWVLSCTFVRTLEDRGLVARARIASADGSASDSEQQFYGLFPFLGPADYLLAVFRELVRFPGLAEVFDARHNPVWRLAPSADAARGLIAFFRERGDEDGGGQGDGQGEGKGAGLRWSFVADPARGRADTRFLGDLYQDLNTDVRKRYALLQTPDFVEELILEETLDPAIERFGLAETKVLDPTCGSGHFLLGAFARLLERWEREAPGLESKERVGRALGQVYGADINPYAVAIARFRLVLAATVAAGIERLDAEGVLQWPVRLCVCNSLLRPVQGEMFSADGSEVRVKQPFDFEDLEAVRQVFGPNEARTQFTAVVGNPPYITEKDAVVRDAVRERYVSAAGKYALSAPFTERFFQLAQDGGFVGMINSNAWTKREFGKSLIEQALPRYRLNLVVDTSGAYIPGHGTPTLMLFGQNAKPTGAPVRTVQGKRGEPSTPEEPERGLVWSSIREHRNEVGHEDDFISVVETPGETFARHPWSLGGGGAAELKEQLEEVAEARLGDLASSIGYTTICGEDDAFVIDGDPPASLRGGSILVTVVEGDRVRDWSIQEPAHVIFPYGSLPGAPVAALPPNALVHLWPFRTNLSERRIFGQTAREKGINWYEHIYRDIGKLRTPLSIAYAEVATHNHFVLDHGGKVFKQTAPVIKLKPDATEDDHLALLGLLNSSVACFWLKQVAHNKGSTVDQHGARQRTAPFEDFYQFNGTKVAAYPVAEEFRIAREVASELMGVAMPSPVGSTGREEFDAILLRYIALQEELDWLCYRLYGLTSSDDRLEQDLSRLPPVRLGERAFEILLAREIASGEEQSTWFERHGSTPITEIPAHWPESYRATVQRRIDRIESDRNIGLIERPEYKRRWNIEPWENQVDRALCGFLLRRLESDRYWPASDSMSLRPVSLTTLADKATHDPDFLVAGARLRGSDTFDVEQLVAEIALPEAVPVQSEHRYTASGLEKRRDWERTWELQRQEDRGEPVGPIPVPPKYKSNDFQKSDYWRLRGKLDVPKETFLLYSACGKPGETLLGWAGWDHLQQARALTNLYQDRKDQDGWDTPQLLPILTALSEVLPWVEQWHNTPDPIHGTRAGDAFRAFLDEELRRHAQTPTELRG